MPRFIREQFIEIIPKVFMKNRKMLNHKFLWAEQCVGKLIRSEKNGEN